MSEPKQALETILEALDSELGLTKPAIRDLVIEAEPAIRELAGTGNDDFHSGLAIAMQSIRMWGEDTIAKEILDGLGSGVDEFCAYLESEGGIDGETLTYLKEMGLVK